MSYGRNWTGSKYQGYLSATEVAKRVRADLKTAQAEDGSPLAGLTFSVTQHRGSSVDVVIIGFTGDTGKQEWGRRDEATGRWTRYTPETEAVIGTVEQIRNAYNRDDSDSQNDHFDVLYYGSTTFESDWRRQEREAKAAARRAAMTGTATASSAVERLTDGAMSMMYPDAQ